MSDPELMFENPPKVKMLMIFLIPSLILIFGGIIIFLTKRSYIGMITCLLFGFTIFFVFWYREYIVSPKIVIVSNHNITFEYKYNNKKMYKIDDIEVVDVGTTTPTGFLGVPEESIVKFKGKIISIPVSYNIAIELRNIYNQKFGKTPKTLSEYYEGKYSK
jgi:hypothetical protein